MKPLITYDLIRGDLIELNSPICNVAESVAQYFGDYNLQAEANGLTQAYFNQWTFAIDAYRQLYNYFEELNNADDTTTEGNLVSAYDLKGEELDTQFRHYSYLIVISLKSLLDSVICLLDVSQNKKVRNDYYPNFFSYGKKWWEDNHIAEIETELNNLGKEDWILNLRDIRNNIIHKGFLLRPALSF